MTRPASRRVAVVVATVLAAVGCDSVLPDEPAVQETIVVDEGGRAAAIRDARVALAEPVPRVVAEARAFRDVLDEVWTASGDSALRASLVEVADPTELLLAADELAAVELGGDTPDLVDVRAQVAALVEEARAIADAGPAELADLPALVPADERLVALTTVWDVPGSYSQQLARFEGMAVTATELAAEFDRDPTLPCTQVWARRVAAAELLATRTEALLDLLRARDGVGFDEARESFGADPFDTGGRSLGELDAVASACWSEDSAVTAGIVAVDDTVRALTSALDPPDLRAP